MPRSGPRSAIWLLLQSSDTSGMPASGPRSTRSLSLHMSVVSAIPLRESRDLRWRCWHSSTVSGSPRSGDRSRMPVPEICRLSIGSPCSSSRFVTGSVGKATKSSPLSPGSTFALGHCAWIVRMASSMRCCRNWRRSVRCRPSTARRSRSASTVEVMTTSKRSWAVLVLPRERKFSAISSGSTASADPRHEMLTCFQLVADQVESPTPEP